MTLKVNKKVSKNKGNKAVENLWKTFYGLWKTLWKSGKKCENTMVKCPFFPYKIRVLKPCQSVFDLVAGRRMGILLAFLVVENFGERCVK